MREIKFRGRGVFVFDATHSNWYYGYLLRKRDVRFTIRTHDEDREFYVDPATVGQFTGLKDSEDKEIYEGDVVRVDSYGEESIHKIVYGDYWQYPAFDLEPYLDCESNGVSYCMADNETTITVIGNVHDNPDLLEADHEKD